MVNLFPSVQAQKQGEARDKAERAYAQKERWPAPTSRDRGAYLLVTMVEIGQLRCYIFRGGHVSTKREGQAVDVAKVMMFALPLEGEIHWVGVGDRSRMHLYIVRES